MTAEILADMCRQIAVMTGSGIPVARAMEVLKCTTDNKRIAAIYGELGEWIERGCAIGDAMEEMGVFPEMAVNMFRAAEVSGQLTKTAYDMAEHYRKEHRIMSQMQAATLYPKLLCIMAAGIVLFVFLVIMPMVEPLFYGVELPWITQMLMKISSFLKEDWHIAAGLLVAAVILEPIILSIYAVRCSLDKIVLYVPLLGRQMRIIYTARFARSLSGLYASGVPMVDGLEIASRTLDNRYLEEQFQNVVRAVKNGQTLSCAIESVKELDKKLPAIIFVGEETGKLDIVLLSLAEGYEHEAEIAVNKMISLLEPLMIVAIGIVVAIILLGIMIPMWSLYEYLE